MPAESDELVATTALLLTRLARLHEALIKEQCDRHDLASADFRVLAFLHLHGAENAASPALIGSWIVQTSGGLTATLGRLAERGFVERRGDPSDGRGKLVAITPRGQDAYGALLADVADRFGRLTDGVDLVAVSETVLSLLGPYEAAAGRPRSSTWPGLTNPFARAETVEEPA